MGLNISRVSENALKEAIGRLRGSKQETSLNSLANLGGRDRDLDPGAGLHRPVGYQATSLKPHDLVECVGTVQIYSRSLLRCGVCLSRQCLQHS